MNKNFFHRAGLTFVALALAFSFIPTSSVRATNDNLATTNSTDSSAPTLLNDAWGTPTSDSNIKEKAYCGESYKNRFSACDGYTATSQPIVSSQNGSGYIDVSLHSGAHGHFDEGDPDTYTKTWHRVDSFNEYTAPIADDAGYVFAGWSTFADASEPNVEIGAVRVGELSTGDTLDLYAVWSDTVYVYYYINNGFWESPSGDIYQIVLMEYPAGSHFQSLPSNPAPFQNVYNFRGWNTQMNSGGTPLDSSTVLNKYISEAYVVWEYDPTRVDAFELTTDETDTKWLDVTVGVSVPVFRFTAPSAGYYEIYTSGISDLTGVIYVQDAFDRKQAGEELIDPTVGFSDVHAYYEMQAGETIYIRFLEGVGNFMTLRAAIRQPETCTVTFDANHSSAHFGEDQSQTTMDIVLPKGKDIKRLFLSELAYDETSISWGSWIKNREPSTDEPSYLLVEGPMTVYALYTERITVHLDFNGGYHPFDKDVHSIDAKFKPSEKFETPNDPDIDNPHLDFVGWARSATATEPDSDIIEGGTPAADLKNQTLYAVYGDKVTTTFRTTAGAYMLEDPSVTVYESTRGDGHIFYGMSIQHYNLNVKHEGWVDQNGVEVFATSDIDGLYHIHGDTTFTPILKYEMNAQANGGYFVEGCGLGTCNSEPVRVPFGEDSLKFSYSAVSEKAGTPLPNDTSKYFLGYATSAIATEPDIIDGSTWLEDLAEIYAVWGDDEAFLDDSISTTWEQGSTAGLRLVFHRHDDRLTYAGFSGVSLDGELLPAEVYDAEEGSLILTLHADYLSTLSSGDHQLAVHFSDIDDIMTTISIAKAAPTAPNTGDNSIESSLTQATSFASLGFAIAVLLFATVLDLSRRRA